MASTDILCISAAAALFGVVGLLVGLRRGFNRAIVRLFLLAVSAVAALLLTYPVAKAVSGWFVERLPELLDASMRDMIGELSAASPTFEALLPELSAAALSVVLFGLLFIVISLLMLIPYAIIFAGTRRRGEDGKPVRPGVLGSIGGLAIGAVAGLFVFAVLLAPISGVSESFERVLHYMNETEREALPEWLDEPMLREVNASVPVSVVRECGGRFATDTILTLHLPDGNVKLSDELENTVDLMRTVSDMTGGEDKSPAALLHRLADFAKKDSVVSTVVSEALPYAADKWKNGEAFLGVKPDDLGIGGDEDDPLSAMLNAAIEALAGADPDTVDESFETIASILDVTEDFMASVEGDVTPEKILQSNLIPDVLDALEKNDNLAGMTEACVSTVIRSVGIAPKSLDDTFCANAAAAFNTAGGTDDLADAIGDALGAAGFTASDKTLEGIAGYFMNAYGGRTVSADDVRELLTKGKI